MSVENREVVNRIDLIINSLGFNSKGAFADAVGLGRSNLSQIMQGKRVLGDNVINKICLSLGISKSWLLTGEGNMLNAENSNGINFSVGNNVRGVAVGSNINANNYNLELQKEIEYLKNQIKEKDKLIDDLRFVIDALKSK